MCTTWTSNASEEPRLATAPLRAASRPNEPFDRRRARASAFHLADGGTAS